MPKKLAKRQQDRGKKVGKKVGKKYAKKADCHIHNTHANHQKKRLKAYS